MTAITTLSAQITEKFSAWIESTKISFNELTIEVKAEHLLYLCTALRDQEVFLFNQLLDVCGVDYLHYGLDDWQTESATETGFSRGVTDHLLRENAAKPTRFAVVYHLLSLTLNHRIRLRVSLAEDQEL